MSPEIAPELRGQVVMGVLARYEVRWGRGDSAQSTVVRTLFESCAFDARSGSPTTTWTTPKLRDLLKKLKPGGKPETLGRILKRLAARLRLLREAKGEILITVEAGEYAVRIVGPRAVDREDGRAEIFLTTTIPRYIGPRGGEDRLVINAPANAARSTTNPLPPQVSTYVPEEDVIATILNGIAAQPRVRIGIAGLPGSGKTELAKDLARRLGASLQREAIFVAMGHRGVTEVTQELAAISAAYFGEDRGTVIVLDDAYDARVFDRWVEPEACIVIVTARHTLSIVGCRWHLKRGVAPDIARMLLRATSMRDDVCADEREWSHDSGILESDSAVFWSAAGLWSDYEWWIAHHSGWMPAAIAEAGAYLAANPHSSATDYYVKLELLMDLLPEWEEPQERPLWRSDTPVETLVRQSMSELSEQSQYLFGRLAVFKKWFTRRAAVWVTEYEEDLIPALVSRGLIEYDEATDALRVPFYIRDLLERFIQERPVEWRKANLLRATFLADHLRYIQFESCKDEYARALVLMRDDVVDSLEWTMTHAPADKFATDSLIKLCDLLLPDTISPVAGIMEDETREAIISDLYRRFVPASGKPRTVKIAAKVSQLRRSSPPQD